jgi:hypothetical protein
LTLRIPRCEAACQNDAHLAIPLFIVPQNIGMLCEILQETIKVTHEFRQGYMTVLHFFTAKQLKPYLTGGDSWGTSFGWYA